MLPESTNGAPLLPRHDDDIEEDKPSNYFLHACFFLDYQDNLLIFTAVYIYKL